MKNILRVRVRPYGFTFLHLSALLVAIIAAVGSHSSRAADAAWNVDSDNTWATDPNWNPAAAPGATSGTTSTDTATFGTIITAARVVTVDANRNIGGINFSGNSFAYTLSGGNLLLSSGGLIQSSGAGTAHTDIISSAIAIQGDGGAATFTAGASTSGRALNITGGVAGASTAGNVTTLTLNGANTGATTNLNTIGGIIGNGVGGGTLAIAKSDAGTWFLGGANTYSGGTAINNGTLTVTAPTALGTGAVTVASGATLGIKLGTGNQRVTNSVSGAGGVSFIGFSATSQVVTLLSPTFTGNVFVSRGGGSGNPSLVLANYANQAISGAVTGDTFSFLQKTGTGTLTLSGSNGNNFGTKLYGGTLVLDYGVNNTSKLSDSNSFALGGGTVSLSGGSHTEVVNATSIDQGGLTQINRSSGTSTLALNAFTRTSAASSGGAVNFAENNLATTDTTNTNGILGGWATVGATGSADWAMNSSGGADGAITGYAGYTTWIDAAKTSTVNYSLLGSATNSASTTINTVKIDTSAGSQVLDLGSTQLTFGANTGILFVGGQDYAINGTGSLRAASAGELIVQQWGAGTLTINAPVVNNGTSKLTISGPGKVVLTASNTYAGATYLNQGTVSIGANNAIGAEGTGAALYINGATLQATETFALANSANIANNKRAVFLGGQGATFEVAATKTLTVPGIIANIPNSAGTGGTSGNLTKAGSGTMLLTGANTYTGFTHVDGGILALGSTGSLASTSISIANGAAFDVTAKGISGYNLSGIGLTIDTDGTTGGLLDATAIALALGGNLTINVTSSITSDGNVDLFAFGSETGNFNGVALAGTVNVSLVRTSDVWSGTSGGRVFSFDQTKGILSFTSVPEPSTYALGISGLLIVAVATRRRRSR